MFWSFTSIKRDLYTIATISCSVTLKNVCLFIWLLLHCIILTVLRFVFIYKAYRKWLSKTLRSELVSVSSCSIIFFSFCKHCSESELICEMLDFKYSLLSRSTLSFRPDNAYPLTIFKTSVTKACLTVISQRTDQSFFRLLYALSFLVVDDCDFSKLLFLETKKFGTAWGWTELHICNGSPN